MRQPSTAVDRADDIDLGAIGAGVLRAIPLLLVLSVLVAGLVYAGLSLVAPRYDSEALMVISSRATANPYGNPSQPGPQDVLAVRSDAAAINTHVRAMQSADLAAKVIEALNLDGYKEFNGTLGAPDGLTAIMQTVGLMDVPRPEDVQREALLKFEERLRVYSPRQSRSIVVGFGSSDPNRAADVANRLVEMYSQMLAEQAVSETEGVQLALEPQIARLTKEAAEAEAAVEAFRGEANIFKGTSQAGLNEQQLSELQAELSKVKIVRSDAEARVRQARELMRSGNADVLPDVQKSRLVQNLIESRVRLERQVSELSATLLPAHPRMRQLQADLSGLKKQIRREVGKIVDGVTKEARVAAMREDALKKRVDKAKARIVDTGPDEAKLRTLEADARSKRAELERLRSQFEANRARLQDSRAIPLEAQIVSLARPAVNPSFPKKMPTALLAVVATFLLGIAWIITKALLTMPSARSRAAAHARYAPYAEQDTDLAQIRPQRAAGRSPSPVMNGDATLSARPNGAASPARASEKAEDAAAARGVGAKVALDRFRSMTSKKDRSAEATTLSASPSDRLEAGDAPADPPDEAPRLSAALEEVKSRSISGVRALIVSDENAEVFAREVETAVSELADLGRSVIVIDWASPGEGLSQAFGKGGLPGLAALATGDASFEEVVTPLNAMGVHFVSAGAAGSASVEELTAAEADSVFVALEGVYDFAIVVGYVEPARSFFKLIDGRCDVGVVLDRRGKESRYGSTEQSTFLDFEVEGMDVIVHPIHTTGDGSGPSASRIARAIGSGA